MPKAAVSKKTEKKEPKAKGEKKKKDPNAPKRGLSAYMFFCQDMRDTIKSEGGPNISFTDITKELGKQWKELSEADKVPYQEKAVEDKKRYEGEMKHYKPPADTEGGGKKSTPKKKAAPKGKKKEESPPQEEGEEEEEEEEEEDDE